MGLDRSKEVLIFPFLDVFYFGYTLRFGVSKVNTFGDGSVCCINDFNVVIRRAARSSTTFSGNNLVSVLSFHSVNNSFLLFMSILYQKQRDNFVADRYFA